MTKPKGLTDAELAAWLAARRVAEREKYTVRTESQREADRERQRAYYLANRKRLLDVPDAKREAKREYLRQWRIINQDTIRSTREGTRSLSREKSREYYRSNLEKERERNRRYRKANPHVNAAQARRYRAANPEKARDQNRRKYEANRERAMEAARLYRLANPEKVAAWANLRRARLAGVPSEPWTTLEILERDAWTCMIEECRNPDGRTIDPSATRNARWAGTIDHKIPISKGGYDTRDNLQAAHRACNCGKKDRLEKGPWVHSDDEPF